MISVIILIFAFVISILNCIMPVITAKCQAKISLEQKRIELLDNAYYPALSDFTRAYSTLSRSREYPAVYWEVFSSGYKLITLYPSDESRSLLLSLLSRLHQTDGIADHETDALVEAFLKSLSSSASLPSHSTFTVKVELLHRREAEKR